jgi:hypothetical protein
MLDLPHLDERTRRLMLEEVDYDLAAGTLYVSPRLSNTGVVNYVTLLKQAVRAHDDSWLAEQLSRGKRLRATEYRRKRTGGFSIVRVPVTAARIIAEEEINRFYVRAVCRLALEDGVGRVVVYRAREARQPRPESEEMIGKSLDARQLLDDLRRHAGTDPVLRMPPGPGSGLSVRLPAAEETAVARR